MKIEDYWKVSKDQFDYGTYLIDKYGRHSKVSITTMLKETKKAWNKSYNLTSFQAQNAIRKIGIYNRQH